MWKLIPRGKALPFDLDSTFVLSDLNFSLFFLGRQTAQTFYLNHVHELFGSLFFAGTERNLQNCHRLLAKESIFEQNDPLYDVFVGHQNKVDNDA